MSGIDPCMEMTPSMECLDVLFCPSPWPLLKTVEQRPGDYLNSNMCSCADYVLSDRNRSASPTGSNEPQTMGPSQSQNPARIKMYAKPPETAEDVHRVLRQKCKIYNILLYDHLRSSDRLSEGTVTTGQVRHRQKHSSASTC